MLPEPQQRRLAEIEHQLRLSDSQLTHRFSLFAELVAGQEMPHRERLPLTLRARMAILGRITSWRSRPVGSGSAPAALLLFPVLLAMIVCTLLLVAGQPHAGAGCSGRSGTGRIWVGAPPSGAPASWTTGCPASLPAAHHR